MHIDGSHTPAKKGGAAVGYQGRKACKTSNSLYLSDSTGQMIAVSTAQSGEHNDLFNIVGQFNEMIGLLEEATIDCRGIFLNADPGFDSADFKQACNDKEIIPNVKPNKRNQKEEKAEYEYFDELLYKQRTKIEHANAWMDAFKALLIRYEKRTETWMALQWITLTAMFCRKLKV